MEANIKRQGVVARAKAWYHPGTGGEEQPDIATTNALEGSNNNEGGEFNDSLDPPHDDGRDDELQGHITTLLVTTETYGGDEPEELFNEHTDETCGDKTYFKFSNAGAGAYQHPAGAGAYQYPAGTEVHIIFENEEQGRGKAGVTCDEVEVEAFVRGVDDRGKAGVTCNEVEVEEGGEEEEESRSAISTGGYYPASAVYHLIDGTPSGLQECVGGGARAGTRARAAAAAGRCSDVEMRRVLRSAGDDWLAAIGVTSKRVGDSTPGAEIDRLIDHGRI